MRRCVALEVSLSASSRWPPAPKRGPRAFAIPEARRAMRPMSSTRRARSTRRKLATRPRTTDSLPPTHLRSTRPRMRRSVRTPKTRASCCRMQAFIAAILVRTVAHSASPALPKARVSEVDVSRAAGPRSAAASRRHRASGAKSASRERVARAARAALRAARAPSAADRPTCARMGRARSAADPEARVAPATPASAEDSAETEPAIRAEAPGSPVAASDRATTP